MSTSEGGGICSSYQWGLSYEWPNHFIQAQWTANRTAYLAYRILLLIFVLLNFMGKLVVKEPEYNAYFMIYLTNWGLVAFASHQIFDLILILREYYAMDTMKPGFSRT